MRRPLRPTDAPRARSRWRSETAAVAALVLVVVSLHLATNGLYGFR
jgi:hypothetical protein